MRGLEWWDRLNMGFRYGNPVKFVSPQCNWFLQPYSFILYRIFLAAYMTIWLVLVILYWGEAPYYEEEADTKWKLLIYFSNWTYIVFTAHFVVAAFNALFYHSVRRCKVSSRNCDAEKQKTKPNPCILPIYLRLQWFLQTIAYGATPPLISAYWRDERSHGFDKYNWTAFNMHVHGVNYLLLIVDTILVATPVRCAHSAYLSLYGFSYLIFTALYYVAGGTNEYGETYLYYGWVDWERDPWKTALTMFFSTVIILPSSQLVFFITTYVRTFLSNRLGCNPQVYDDCQCDDKGNLVKVEKVVTPTGEKNKC